jgi:CshA-type fibril repeat protein
MQSRSPRTTSVALLRTLALALVFAFAVQLPMGADAAPLSAPQEEAETHELPAQTSSGPVRNLQHADYFYIGGRNTVALLDGGEPVTELVVTGVGTYKVESDVRGGDTFVPLTFRPVSSYYGTPDSVIYAATDAEGNTKTGTYTVTVVPEWERVAGALHTYGEANEIQETTIPLLVGDTVTFVNSEQQPTNVLTLAEGTIRLDPDTGVITFTPLRDYIGAVETAVFWITHSYTSELTYGHYLAAVAGLELESSEASQLSKVKSEAVGTRCVLTKTKAKVCKVRVTALVNGKNVNIGHGETTLEGRRAGIRVTVQLTKRGQTLVARPRGVTATAVGRAFSHRTASWLRTVQRLHFASTAG